MTTRKKLTTALIAIIGLLVVGILLSRLVLVPAVSPQPDNLGVVNGQLADCPNTPNCVSSQATDAEHRISPIPFEGSAAEAQETMLGLVENMPRSRHISTQPTYLHAEFRSPTFAFIDDLELYFDETAQVIHVRSAARLGQSDMGVNRNRVESLRAAFEGSNE
jgi:uncharacterized protein (DUF1499 family)